ncbi:hypothetical protein [Flavobacterium selenitireducens]|uniref:hypothetical protein n=1 Tax=Flavobacterium selenitireducens TaxID=2722704 RepID=UPI00168B2716|nr:hypothetical protein [Flavobacterium selenitireducens]MBD3582756.1 hypothetical protein [Flavobacterium selenitireducens]
MNENMKNAEPIVEVIDRLKPYLHQWLNDATAIKLMAEMKNALEYDIRLFFDETNSIKPVVEFPEGWENAVHYSEVISGDKKSRSIVFFGKQAAISAVLTYAEVFITNEKLNHGTPQKN